LRERNQRQSPARKPGFVIGGITEIGETGEPAYGYCIENKTVPNGFVN
jgi:hypothetical protein